MISRCKTGSARGRYSLFLLLSALGFIPLLFACSGDRQASYVSVPPDTTAFHSALSVRDVAYGAHAQQKFDIDLPAHRKADSTKVLIFIHGGAWAEGDKNEMQSLISLMREEWPEVALVNVNYRLATSTQFKHPAQIQDIQAVIDYLNAHHREYGIATSYALVGASAGAHLSMLYAYAFDDKHLIHAVSDLYGPANLYDWEWYSTAAIKPLIETFLGVPWAQDTALYQSASPMLLVRASTPPTLIFHGASDLVVPLYQSQWLAARLKNASVPYEYTEYFLDGHGFNGANNADCMRKTAAFFKKNW